MVAQFLAFKRRSILFSWWAVTSLHPTNSIVGMDFSTNPSPFIVCILFTDVILNIGWRTPFVVWICIQPIIPDIEVLSMFFYFCKQKTEYNLPLQIVFLKTCPCCELFWLLPTPGHFLRTRVIYSPAVLVTIRQPLALVLKLLLWDTVARRQHYYVLNTCY